MSTYATRIARIRRSLNEPVGSEQEWDDTTQIIPEISLAERWFARWLGRLRNAGRFEHTENVTLAASAETVALSGLTYALVSIKFIELQTVGGNWVLCEELPEGDDSWYRYGTAAVASSNTRPVYRLSGTNIRFLPVSTAARTLKVTYNWVPAAKTSGASLETPEEYDDIIDARVLYFLLGDEGESESSFENRYASRLAEIERFETGRNRTSRPETVKAIHSPFLFGGIY